MTSTEFDSRRRDAEITSSQIANHVGATVKELLAVETGRAEVRPWMVSALNELIALKAAA